MHKERLARLQLIRSQNVGPAIFRNLIRRFSSAEKALAALPDLSRRAGGRKITICSAARAEREAEQLEKIGGKFVMLGDEDYPETLSLLEHEPPVLSVLGHPHLLRKNTIGIVGTRKASAAAISFTRRIVGDLKNFVTVSGLALGIDTAAHEASLKQGTIAVLAGGVDVLYPPENKGLYEKIAATGCLVSEMAFGQKPLSQHFPRRNRIISGLSLAVLIVEAPLRSGAMITARTAAEQGRLVCAVPGSPLDPRTKGTNKLLREGATLVESAEDILREVSPIVHFHLAESTPPYKAPKPITMEEPTKNDYEKLVEILSPTSVPLDDIIRISGQSPQIVNIMLADLELAGRIHRDWGNKISILN